MENGPAIVALILSGLALSVSATTAWLTFFRRGKLKMTRPSVIFFGFDSTPGKPDPKIFLRGLLYSTSKKGQLIENLYVRLSRGEATQNFSVWVYGQSKELSRGSGLFVGADGVAANHHFLLAPDQKSFSFHAGAYRLQLFGSIVGGKRTVSLFDTELVLSNDDEVSLNDSAVGVYFDWGPDSQMYYSHVDKKPERLSPSELLSILTPTPVDKESSK